MPKINDWLNPFHAHSYPSNGILVEVADLPPPLAISVNTNK
jgi:hypothetical protein